MQFPRLGRGLGSITPVAPTRGVKITEDLVRVHIEAQVRVRDMDW